ncbi:BTAD domain-containing putative transcriptional regulator [Pseudosporangium ferrugineum]|uniref:BTAD domain-containing putative transcriptional regulator n=1 Tax=Pseudosporangium ferrugineum TaxID=439699 RepID=UPI000D06704C|nr:BTAD domain-containing putative transcriptional regulator [Pseudosporangium ferrugineum]
MRITTLGPLAVNGQPVRGERLAAVIRELVGARGRAVSTAGLADAVWHGAPPEDAGGAVQALISRVRRLGVPVVAGPGGYRVPPDRVESDVVAARALADRARAALGAGDPRSARRDADAARALFPEVPELADDEAVRLFGDVAAVRAEAALAGAGAYDEVDLRRLAARTPPDEPAVALLVRVLAAQGRDAEAMEAIERLRAELADRYGTDPSAVIAAVHLALIRGELTAGLPAARPARVTMPGSWRRPGTALIGRDGDAAAVERLLAEAPLVTVVATGGAGKTRLAAEVARRATGPVRVVELAGVRTPAEVLPVVLAALGGAETAGGASAIGLDRRVLGPRDRLRMVAPELDGLLVLDNCEHVLDAAAVVVADLLAAAGPGLALLATSRAPLGLAGEAVYRLHSLPDAEALCLLESRARAGGAAVTWDDERMLALCRRLDHLPLALELAAARLRHMPIDDLLASLGDRFALLDDALRGLPERHASLWAMVDWSRELLAPADRDLFARLAVIPAPFTAEAAAAVAGAPEVRRGLAVLVEQSLLNLEEGDGGPARYRMLETVREYGEARLGDRDAAMAGLVSWARARAIELASGHVGPSQVESLDATAREQENLVAALRWAVAHGDDRAAVDLAAAVFQLWSIRGLHLEVSTWARTLFLVDDPVARRGSAIVRGRASGRPLPDADRLARLCLIVGVNSGITGPVRLTVLARRALTRLMTERRAEVSGRHAALAEAMPGFDRFDAEANLRGAEQLVGHPDAYVRAFGFFMRAVMRENGGMPEASRADAEIAYGLFGTEGDHWGMAMAAQAIGHSFSARRDSAVTWMARSVRHMELVGAEQDARSMRIMLDARLALDGDAEAERRLRETVTARGAGENQAEQGDAAQAYLGLAHLAWQRRDFAGTLACADEVVRMTGDFSIPMPQPRIMFRVAAAVLYLTVAAEHPVAHADAYATDLLRRSRDDTLSAQDIPLAGAWAMGGAMLAAYRGDPDAAGELWALAIRAGATMSMLLPPGDDGRLTAALGDEDRRRAVLDERREEPVAVTVALIRDLMDRLLGAGD